MPQEWFHLRAVVFGLDLNVWGCFTFFALLAFLFLNHAEGKRKGLDGGLLLDYGLLVSLAALFGARGLHEWQYYHEYGSKGIAFYALWDGGLAMFGGLVAGIGFTFWFIRRKKLSFWSFLDTITPGTVAGLFLVRVGCFLVNDHEGALTTLPWGVEYPGGILKHPVGLYLALNFGLALAFVWFVGRKLCTEEGQLFLWFGSYYCLSSFLIDFTRQESAEQGLIVSQWGELIVLGCCLLLIWFKRAQLSGAQRIRKRGSI